MLYNLLYLKDFLWRDVSLKSIELQTVTYDTPPHVFSRESFCLFLYCKIPLGFSYIDNTLGSADNLLKPCAEFVDI